MKRAVPLVAGVVAALAAASWGSAALKPLPGIRTPSRNIQCTFVPAARGSASSLVCMIAHANYSAALQHRCIAPPTSLDWHGFELPATRKGSVSCSGGIFYDPASERPVFTSLAYGRTWRHGPFTCVSRRTGLTCTNGRGHGLFLSRESWRAW